MYHSLSRIVYHDRTVTIDYDKTLRLFLTEKERLPFSAEKLLSMLNRWAKVERVQSPATGIQITIEEAHCILTQRATRKLLIGYQHCRDWQVEYPFISELFARHPLAI